MSFCKKKLQSCSKSRTSEASKPQSEKIKQIKHVSCERSELRQNSAVFANQLKQASQALSTLAKRANQANYARLHSRLRLPSHTGREDDQGRKMSFKIAQNLICISLESKYI